MSELERVTAKIDELENELKELENELKELKERLKELENELNEAKKTNPLLIIGQDPGVITLNNRIIAVNNRITALQEGKNKLIGTGICHSFSSLIHHVHLLVIISW